MYKYKSKRCFGSPAVWINQFPFVLRWKWDSFPSQSRHGATNRSFHLWTILRLALLCINPTVISLEAGGFYIHPDSWHVTSCAQQETRQIFKPDMPIFIALYVFGRLEHGSYKATRPNRPGFLLPFVAISCEFVARIGHGSSQGTMLWNITNKMR